MPVQQRAPAPGLQFVTPADRHEGRHVTIMATRREGMRRAREERKMAADGGTGEVKSVVMAVVAAHRFRSSGL
jgi:hypothetical protein